jgi:rubrerythrin
MTHHPLDGNMIAADAHYDPDDGPPWDCLGCQGGDKWPADEAVWRCPVCDTEYQDIEDSPQ